jgi:hypothetical protein
LVVLGFDVERPVSPATPRTPLRDAVADSRVKLGLAQGSFARWFDLDRDLIFSRSI